MYKIVDGIDLETRDYTFMNKNFNLYELVKILKEIRQISKKNTIYESIKHLIIELEDFSFKLDDDMYRIDYEDYIYNQFIFFEEFFQNDFEIKYDEDKELLKNIIMTIANNTRYVYKHFFDDYLLAMENIQTEIALDDIQHKGEYENSNDLIKQYLIDNGSQNIFIYFNDGIDNLSVRYEKPRYKKEKKRYVIVGYEDVEESFEDLKEEAIQSELENIKSEIHYNFEILKKEFIEFGTDEKLSKDEKVDALHNTLQIIMRTGDIKNINIKEMIEKHANDLLGTTNNRHLTELLNIMHKQGLNQISKGKNGKVYYDNLLNIFLEYYKILDSYESQLRELKYIDDGFSAGYSHNFKLSIIKEQWYKFYKTVKDKYRYKSLYSIYFSYLHNAFGYDFSTLKKIFKTTRLPKLNTTIQFIPTI